MRMTKTMKKVLLSVCSAVFGLMMGVLVFLGAPVNVKADVTTTTVMYCDGASIRLAEDGKNGIRFHVRVTSNEEGTVTLEGNTYSADEFKALETGILVIPTDKLSSSEELTIEGAKTAYTSGAKAANVTGDDCVWNLKSDEDGYFYEATAYVYNIPESSYDRDFTFRGYYSLGGENYVYTKNENNERSVAHVAWKAKADNYDGEFTAQLNGFLAGVEIENKFTQNFVYRVGNQNAVKLSSLFDIPAYMTSDALSIEAESLKDSGASASYTSNATVANGTLQFSGTGEVLVTITDSISGNSTELSLEVVDAVNATSATSATANNVVLLNNVGFSTLSVANGYTLYGNGFKMTATNDVLGHALGIGFVELNGGILDNVQVICPNGSYSVLYHNQIGDSGNYYDSKSENSGNVRSAVLVDGNSKIINSYISGGRAGVYARSGKIVVDNSMIEGGSVANIYLGTEGDLLLRDVTLIQEPKKATIHDTSKTIMGFSVFVESTEDSTPPITLEGSFTQYAWAHEGYKKYVPSGGDSVVNKVLSKDNFTHTVTYSDGTTAKSVNLGFAYLNTEDTLLGNAGAPIIQDNRTDKASIPYAYEKIDKAYVFSYQNTNGTNAKMATRPAAYVPTAQSQASVLPTVSFNDAMEGMTFATAYSTENSGWTSTLTLDLDMTGDYNFSFSKLLAQKYGKTLSYTVVTKDGVAIDASKTITLADSGINEYVLTITDNANIEHTHYFKLIATKTSIKAPVKIAEPSGDALLVVKSKGGDWTCATPALEGTQIEYYSKSQKKYVTLSLSSLTPTSKGKQNGTNNYWTYNDANGDFTLKITSGYIHEGKQVYGMPVVVDNGGYKMYFTISSTNGYVSTGTSARTNTLTYEFTDANGNTLTFSKTWQLNYADKKDVAQYSYSDFVNGTLTDLLTSSSGGSGCVTPETLVTLADGSQVRVDSLKGDEMLLVWNMETGMLDTAPIMFVDSDPTAEYEIIHLYFSDGTDVKVISEHGFWDYDLNRYVYLDKDAAAYIGHTFAKQDGNTLSKVQLVDVVLESEVTMAWSPVTQGHLCYFVNGMLSMPGGVGGLFNIFDVDAETMTYDYAAVQRDIELYGLFTYEELNAIVELPESMFYEAGGMYLKISIAKGNMTIDELIAMINRYRNFYA